MSNQEEFPRFDKIQGIKKPEKLHYEFGEDLVLYVSW